MDVWKWDSLTWTVEHLVNFSDFTDLTNESLHKPSNPFHFLNYNFIQRIVGGFFFPGTKMFKLFEFRQKASDLFCKS